MPVAAARAVWSGLLFGRFLRLRLLFYSAVSTDSPSAVSSYLASIPGVIMVWGGLGGVKSRLAALRVRCQL